MTRTTNGKSTPAPAPATIATITTEGNTDMTATIESITLLPETAIVPQAQPPVTPRVAVNGNLVAEDTKPELKPELRVADVPDNIRKKFADVVFIPILNRDKPAVPSTPPEYEVELEQALEGLKGLRNMPGMESAYQNAVAGVTATLREKYSVKDLGDVMTHLSDHPHIADQVARVSALTRQLQALLWNLGDELKDTKFRIGNVRVESDLAKPIMIEERRGKSKSKRSTSTSTVTPEDLYKHLGAVSVYFTHNGDKYYGMITKDGKVKSAKGGMHDSFNLWLKGEYPSQHIPSAYVAIRIVHTDGTIKKLDEIRDTIK